MSKVEKVGVSYLSAFIAGSDILDPKFDTDDKNISWDGTIYVFENEKREKEFYSGTVPVQIKCTDVEEFSDEFVSHKFEVKDLINYEKNGGILLFVVEVKSQNRQFFFSMLLPSDLKDILRTKGGKKTRSLRLTHLSDENTNTIENVCREFILHSKKQISTIEFSIPIEECVEFNIPVISDGTPIIDYVFNHEFYRYGRRQSDKIDFFVDKVRFEAIGTIELKPIIVNNRTYYPQYEYKKTRNEEKILLGKGVQINLTHSQIIYDLQGTITQQLDDCAFLIDFISTGTLSIGINQEDNLSFKDFSNKDDFLQQIKNIYTYLSEIKTLLEIFHIEPDKLDIFKGSFTQLDKTSITNLDFLIKTFVRHEKISSIPEQLGIFYLVISNLVIGVFVYKWESEDFLTVLNLFEPLDAIPFTVTLGDSQQYRISPYVVMTKSNLLTLDNIDIGLVVTDIKQYDNSEIPFGYINQFGLELLKAYDESKRDEFLSGALEVFNFNAKFPYGYEISRINQLQVYRRQRELIDDEVVELMNMRIQFRDDDRLLCGISILLESKADFKMHFGKFTPTVRDEFMNYPIYTLAQQLSLT